MIHKLFKKKQDKLADRLIYEFDIHTHTFKPGRHNPNTTLGIT